MTVYCVVVEDQHCDVGAENRSQIGGVQCSI